MQKHAHPPRVVYCAIYTTLTRFTKFRVSNLYITVTPDAANTLHQRIPPRKAIPSHFPSEKTLPGNYIGKARCHYPTAAAPNVMCSRDQATANPADGKACSPTKGGLGRSTLHTYPLFLICILLVRYIAPTYSTKGGYHVT